MKQFSSRYIKLKRTISDFKESLDHDCLEQSYEIDCSIFFKINPNLNMENIIEEYNKKCKKDWKITEYGTDEDDKNICFPYKIIYDLIKETVDKVTNILLDIISEVDDVATIFYVGGFCNSKFVLEMIKNNIQKLGENKWLSYNYNWVNNILSKFQKNGVTLTHDFIDKFMKFDWVYSNLFDCQMINANLSKFWDEVLRVRPIYRDIDILLEISNGNLEFGRPLQYYQEYCIKTGLEMEESDFESLIDAIFELLSSTMACFYYMLRIRDYSIFFTDGKYVFRRRNLDKSITNERYQELIDIIKERK
jgi:hypothetical protein